MSARSSVIQSTLRSSDPVHISGVYLLDQWCHIQLSGVVVPSSVVPFSVDPIVFPLEAGSIIAGTSHFINDQRLCEDAVDAFSLLMYCDYQIYMRSDRVISAEI